MDMDVLLQMSDDGDGETRTVRLPLEDYRHLAIIAEIRRMCSADKRPVTAEELLSELIDDYLVSTYDLWPRQYVPF